MSGHSKWSQIKRQKGAADARRAARFTKLGRAIAVAARAGADPGSNVRLRLVIDQARSANVPNDVIARAIRRGGGTDADRALAEVTYEAYGPGGTALLITTLTDNRNRTTSEIRRTLSDHAATLAAAGSVAWQFRLMGVLRVSRERLPEPPEALVLALIDAGAQDVATSPEGTTITTPPDRLDTVRRVLQQRPVPVDDADLESVPTTTVALRPDARAKLDALIQDLDGLDDVQTIATNARDAA